MRPPARATGSPGVPASPTRFESRREDILTAAAALINERGLRDATLSAIASEVGLNLKSLRYYFERREDLVSTAFLRSIRLHRDLVEGALRLPDVEGRVRRFVVDYFALRARVSRGEDAPFVHFGDIRALAPPHSEAVIRDYVAFFRRVRDMLADPERPVRRALANARAHMLISQLLWSVVWAERSVPEDYPAVGRRFSDALLGGMARRRVALPASDGATEAAPQGEKLSTESFLLAATRSINAEGYRGAAVDRISARLSVTKGSFYHHNDNRDGLVVACFERTFAMIRAAQDAALTRPARGIERVAAATIRLVAQQLVPDGVMLRTSALTAIGPELRSLMQARMESCTLRFADMLNDGIVDGSVRPCNVRIASEMITGAVNAAEELPTWIGGAGEAGLAGFYVRLLLEGLLASDPSPPPAPGRAEAATGDR